MPAPLAAAAWIAGVAAALSLAAAKLQDAEDAINALDPDEKLPTTRAMNEIDRKIRGAISEYEDDAISWAASQTGINIDLSQPLNAYTLTEAINTGVLAGTGLRFTNLLDGDSIKRDMRRIALEQVGESIGLKGTGTPKDLVAGMRSYAIGEIIGDIDGLARLGISPNKQMLDIVARFGTPQSNDPVDFSEEGISNRQRQAEYAASHSRKWVNR